MTFSLNVAHGGSGGAMYFEGTSVTFGARGEMRFISNTANKAGGALYLSNESYALFNADQGKLEFSSNVLMEANTSGTAIYLNKSTMIFRAGGMTFVKNKGNIGSVLYATNHSFVEFTSGVVLFENNTSEAGNGVISWDDGSTVAFRYLKSMIARNNYAINGGFLNILDANFIMDSLVIEVTSNTARDNGGAIYLVGSILSFSGADELPFL
jgi:predicted outer membrane repeat protein